MTSNHDLFGMLRGARKRLRKNGRRLDEGLSSSEFREWTTRQAWLWTEWEEFLNRAHARGVVSDFGLAHLRSRENVLKSNWGCKP